MNKYDFLEDKYKIPRSNILRYDEKNGELTIPIWGDHAVVLGNAYLKTMSLDTIFGQMQLLEMELDKLRDNLQKEKDEEKRKSIKSKIADREKSYKTRENYLREKMGNDFDELYDENKKLTHRDFLEYKMAQLEEEAKKLEEMIEHWNRQLKYLSKESRQHTPLSLGDIENLEKKLYMNIKGTKEKLKSIRDEMNDLGEEK